MNPAADVEKFKESSRERAATEEEIPFLWDAIQADEDVYARAALALILFTGCRKNEVLRLRWRDVDFAGAELRLPDTKKGKPEVVPLVPEAIDVLRAVPRGIGDAAVFPHIHIKRAWARIRSRFWLAMHPDLEAELRVLAEQDVIGRSKHAVRDQAAVEARLL